MSEASVRVGVIGTGVMGGHHARVASTLPGAELVGIFDVDAARCAEVAGLYGARAFGSLDEACAAVDAVIIAAPTGLHGAIAGACLRAGCHVLLEKPIAGTEDEGAALVAEAAAAGRILMIGHVERFNPAMTAVFAALNRDELFDAHFQRLSPTPPRDQSADIIFDLMIHDLDLALACAQSPVVGVQAVGQRRRFGFIDHVTASLRFASGATATLTASAVSHERVRAAQIFTDSAVIRADLGGRVVTVHRHGEEPSTLPVAETNPLAEEQAHFLHAIRTNTAPMTDGPAGLAALTQASAIQREVRAQLEARC